MAFGWNEDGVAVPKMTPEREAAYALDYGVARGDLSEQAQLAYDRLAEQRAQAVIRARGSAVAGDAGVEVGGPAGAAAVPVVVYPADLRPGRRWYWLAVATALAGLAWAAVVLVLVVGSVDSFQRVPVPGTGQVSLPSGQYVIYYEAPASVGGPVPLGRINVTPLSNPGAVGGITGYSGSLTYSLGSHQGTAIAVVQISRPGRFLVQATSSITVPGARLAIGPSLTGWILTGVLPTLGLILAGIVVAVVVAVMRRKQRRVILIPPPWPSPPSAA